MKKLLPALKAATALLVSFAFLAGSATVLNVIESAEAAPGPFTCTSNFYQVSNGDMYQYSVTNNTYTKMAQSTNVAALNAAGYNTADNYIYAITSTGNGAGKSTTLYKFANDGSHTSLGVLSGGGASIAAGDFIAPDELLTVNGTGHTPLGTFTLIDTNTATSDPNKLSVSAFTSTGATWAADDFAYNPSNNTIYGIDGTTLYIGTITGSTVAVTTKPVANSGNSTATDAWGATYIDSAGNAYFFDNNNFNLVEISATSLASSTPSALNITQANTLASPNDGASCPTASSPLAPTVVTTTATAITTTTATLNGTVATGIPASSNITTGNIVMCYSTSNTVVNGALSVSPVCAPTTQSTLPANSAATAVALPVSGLAPGTTYYYQLEATNAYGLEGFGAVNNFVTTAATHTVTFAANGGTGTMANETNNAATALTTNTFTRAGYTFAGWVATPGGTGYADGASYSFAADATMTAQWTAIPNSTVTFAANGGTGTMANELNNVTAALTANAFTRAGYTFAGWIATPGGASYTDGQTYAFSSNATMTAQWTAIPNRTVTFDPNGGTGSMVNEVNNVPAALIPNTFTGPGFTFAGWSTSPGGSVVYPDAGTYSFSVSIPLYAQWTAIPNSTVTFAANGGTGTMAPEVNNVPTALTTNTFTRAGFTFAGWDATPGSASYADGQTYAFSSDATMTAQWVAIPNATVTFVANGGTGTMNPESRNVPAALTPNTFTRAGYTFAGWIATPGGAAYSDGQAYQFSSNATMTAQWTAIPNSTVTFVANGGAGTMTDESNNVPTALTTNTFTRPGYTFAGWIATPGSASYTDGQTYAFSSDATMTAQWTAIPNSTVIFAANGGSGTMAPEVDNVPTALTTNTFTRPGYTFAGWIATPGSTPYADGDVYAFDADATMTAQWTAIPNSTVTFAANGGTGTMANELNNVPTALTTNAFTRPGYTFAGWIATPGSTPYADGDVYAFDADATMTAQWTAIPNSTVTFAANGGTGTMAPESDNVPTALTANTFTRAGYTFAGWIATPGSTPYADGDVYAFDADATMTAQWTAIPNSTVTFAANGGTGTMAPEVNNVPTALTANTFTRAGYTFAGWVATPGGTPYADGDSYAFGSSATMTAQWTPIGSKSVTFNANGGTGSMAIEINNVPAALTTNTIVRPGFTFAGWATSANGPIVYTDGATDPFSANEQLYAQWNAIAVLSFDPNGGTGSVASIAANGPTVLPTTTVSRPGYLFKGWNTAQDGSGTEYALGSLYPLTASGVLFAQFTKILAFTGVDTTSTMNLGLLLLGLGVGFVAVAIATRRRPRGQHRAAA